MTLIAIQTYFLQVKKATLSHLLHEFKIDEAVLEHMLSFWIKKGKLKKILPEEESTCNTRCGSCRLGCMSLKKKLTIMPLYEWTDDIQSKNVRI